MTASGPRPGHQPGRKHGDDRTHARTHSGTHGHSHDPDALAALDADVRVSTRARSTLVAVLAALGLLTVLGLVVTWPSGDASARGGSTAFVASGAGTTGATVLSTLPACPPETTDPALDPGTSTTDPSAQPGSTCGAMVVRVDAEAVPQGESAEQTVPLDGPVARSGLQAGDRVTLLAVGGDDGQPTAYSFLEVQRSAPLLFLLVLFVVVVGVVARLRGILALVGLGVGGVVVVTYLLPSLLEGRSGIVVALVGSAAIMYVVLYLAHGLSVRTSTALAGTLFGVAITAGLGVLAIGWARLSGVGDDEGATLTAVQQSLQPRELLTAAIIIAGLGVLNDVTITQSSAVWELRAAAPSLGRRQLFASGMRIGRDHIASTIYTIVFAYAGAALPVLLLLYVYDRPVLDMLQTESLSQEIVRTLASAIGLVLAVPATTAIAALTVGDATVAPTDDDDHDEPSASETSAAAQAD